MNATAQRPAMTAQEIGRAARELWQAWSSGRPLAALPPDLHPRDLDEGYAIQRALDEEVGPAAGWKIAATSKAGQDHLGASGPMVGRLYELERRETGSALSVSGMQMCSAEPEFAFVLAEDIAPGAQPPSLEDLLAAVDSLVLAIEVPDSRFSDFTTVGVPSLAADARCGGFFITGPSVADWRSLDLAAQPTRLECDGREVSAGSGANVLGDPREALRWMAGEVLGRGWPLRAGDIVLTGASAPPVGVHAGDALEAVFDGLGSVEVEFVR
ncbi:MAG TPA: fumarylacetoacetate hydrolase family protein [Solirubrobacteraceae bacterium]|nr:fumarylacetoacetate hydrolase family protein [Solirubrobacteraceae bacterium]